MQTRDGYVTTLRSITASIVLGSLFLTCASDASPAQLRSSQEVIPFELRDNHILLQVSVDASPPLTFILDTGAPYNIVSIGRARSLGLPLQSLGKVIQGVGADPLDAYVVSARVALRLGEVALASAVLLAAPLDMPPECASDSPAGRADSSEGPRDGATGVAEGILGRPLFDRFVVDIDYAARRITLHEPTGYRYAGHGEILRLQMADGIPVLNARVAAPTGRSATARLAVDLGASTALTINRQFADSHQILPPAQALRATNECGFGGAAAGVSFEGTLQSAQIGRVTLLNPMTFFRKNPNGRGFDGLLGGAVLRDFRVILDYSRRRMILEKR